MILESCSVIGQYEKGVTVCVCLHGYDSVYGRAVKEVTGVNRDVMCDINK